jgi:tRNA/rRNA methyltransferase
MRIAFILVEPQLPENVGSCARAIKTMGFNELRLVNSCSHHGDRANWLAYGSGDILESATVYSDLTAAVAGTDFVIGTTARPRKRRRLMKDVNDLAPLLESKIETTDQVAIVFGREDRGLMNEELDRCDLVSTIPLAQPYPSLNLAQAVMVYAHAMSRFSLTSLKRTQSVEASVLFKLKDRLARLLRKFGVMPDSPLFQRLMERALCADDEGVRMLFSMIRKIDEIDSFSSLREFSDMQDADPSGDPIQLTKIRITR